MGDDLDEEFGKLPAELERVATQIVDAAFKVHSEMGAGLLESVYEACLAYELAKRGLKVRRQVLVPIVYDGVVFEAQMLTYLKLTGKRLGFIINFNVVVITQGIKRMIR